MNMPLMYVPFAPVIVVPAFMGVDMSLLDHNHRVLDSGAPNGDVGPASRNRSNKDKGCSRRENPSHILISFLYGYGKEVYSLII